MNPENTAPEFLNIADHFLDRNVRCGRGGRIALSTDEGDLTYAEVQELANRFAQVLTGLGLRQEERVLIALPDGAAFVGALFGILKAGAVAVMVNPQLPPEELGVLFAYSRARCAVVHPSCLESFEAAVAGGGSPAVLLVAGGAATPSSRHPVFEREASGVDGRFETVATHRDDPALWLFSGGTTGRPKAVVQPHRSFANTARLYALEFLGYRESDVTLSVPKLFFGYATGSNLFFPFAAGARAALFAEKPTPEVLFRQIARHRPTILINVPTLINQMARHPEAAEQDLSCLRFATSAGEALPPPLYDLWKETFGVELLDGLGTAEMWHIFLSNRPGAVRPGTLGQVVPGFELDVRDDEGRSLPAGEVGRMWVRGDSRALGYWQNLEKTVEAFRGEWFVGGDLISRDQDGYVTYCGRGDDMVKVGGKWVSPQEVESCLLRHPAVKECAVIAADDEAGLTKPYAFVISRQDGQERVDEALEDELRRHALAHMQPYKHPRRVFFLQEFPRTHLGKVDRGVLRRHLAENHPCEC